MKTINELQRLRVSFGSFEPSAKATPYAAQEAKAVTLTLAYIQRGDKAPTWELLQTGRGLCYVLDQPTMYGYRHGLVYEAETGVRLVAGKTLSAESYISSLRSLPTSDISHIPGLALTVQMKTEKTKMDRLNDQYHGFYLDETTCSLKEVEGDCMEINLPLITTNNLIVALYGSAIEKKLVIHANDMKPQKSSAFVLPMVDSTLDLF